MTSVSVVIPSYNHAAYVAEAIRSALDQSHGDLEVVITDDGSRDGTPDVIRRIADPRIGLEVFEKNRGAGVALNSAIRRARGEFICFLASDDFFLPGKLEKQVRFLRENPHVAAVFGMPRFADQRGAPLAENFNGDIFLAPFTKNLRTRPDWLRHFFYEGNCLSATRPRWCAARSTIGSACSIRGSAACWTSTCGCGSAGSTRSASCRTN